VDHGNCLGGYSPVLEKQTVPRTGLLVKLHRRDDQEFALNFFEHQHLCVLNYLSQIDVWQVVHQEIPDVLLLQELQESLEVVWAEENGIVRITAVTPDDNLYQAQQENLRVMGLPEAWEVSTGEGVLIAVVDTGLDLDHPDLVNKVWENLAEIPDNGLDDDGNGYVDDFKGWDFVNADQIPQDDHSHGSHVAGIAAAETNNGLYIAGVAWDARLMAVKALNQMGDGAWDDVSEAIIYAADQGARIINLSFGDENNSQTIEMAIDYARQKGSLVVASAGNGGAPVLFPAALPQVFAVAATDNGDIPPDWSNRGPEVDVAAPGVEIVSLTANGSFTPWSGTSMSAAHVSGLAALIWALNPDLTAEQVAAHIINTAHDVWSPGFDELTGWGRVDAAAASAGIPFPPVYLPLVSTPGFRMSLFIPALALP